MANTEYVKRSEQINNKFLIFYGKKRQLMDGLKLRFIKEKTKTFEVLMVMSNIYIKSY